MRIAINGIGRIGKQFLIASIERELPWKFFVNDLMDIESAAYLLSHDSVHKPLGYVKHNGMQIILGRGAVGNNTVKFYSERDPKKLPWKKEKIDLVVECTGIFTEREDAIKHLNAGAKKVLISAPAKNNDYTLICGVNDNNYKDHKIVSAGSCTTNCVAVMLKVLHETYRLRKAHFITTHAYTATQSLIDRYDHNLTRGRAAGLNIIPTTSGASQSVVESIPELKGKLEGYALRVPVANGSIASVVAQVEKQASVGEVNKVFKRFAEGRMKKVLEYSHEQLVSSDIIHNPHSCIFDSSLTSVIGDTMSIAGWYDNEWGYANRLVDVAIEMLKKS